MKYNSGILLRTASSMFKFKKLCELKLACHTYKIVNSIVLLWYIYFPLLSETRDRDTRQKYNSCVPDFINDLGTKSVLFSTYSLE